MIVGAFHTAGQAHHVGTKTISYVEESELMLELQLDQLGNLLEEAVTSGEQLRASVITHAIGKKTTDPNPVFRRLLPFAVSQDGALHAEKFYHTVREEFSRTRREHQWKHLAALARVTASEYGVSAPGQAEARELLGV